MSLVGHWELELKTPFGIQRMSLHVRESGDVLVGELRNQFGAHALSSLSLHGDRVAFVADVKLPIGEQNLEFRGYLRQRKMWGKCKSAFGRGDFMAERQP
jgi:hypothetical protein